MCNYLAMFIDEVLAEKLRPIEDLFCAGAILFVHLSQVCSHTALALLFLLKCDLGVAALVFPVCDESGNHGDPRLIALWTLLQLFIHDIVLEVLLPYVYLAMVFSIGGNRFLVEMWRPHAETRLKPQYQTDQYYFNVYIFFYKGVHLVNDFLTTILPINYVLCASVIVTSSYYLIQGQLSPSYRLLLAILTLFPLLDMLITAFAGGEMSAKFTELKTKRKRDNGNMQSKYVRACHAALPPTCMRDRKSVV